MDFSGTSQQYHDHVMRLKLIPEFDGYIPYVGETADGELKEPTEAQLIASFHANARMGRSADVIWKLI